MTELSRKRLIEKAESHLRKAGIELAKNEVSWMLQAAEGVSRARFMSDIQAPPSSDVRQTFDEWVERRRRREPFQYIIGEADFFGRTFGVVPGVLIPRPETETLVEHALERMPGGTACRVWDVGTGSGVIAITVALERPLAEVTATDISETAQSCAQENARRHDASVTFGRHDMLTEYHSSLFGTFDLLISNPPYVPPKDEADMQPEVLDHEPRSALFSGPDPLNFYRALARLGATALQPGGHLIVESHADHASDVAELFALEGYSRTEIARDLFGRDRVVSAVLSG